MIGLMAGLKGAKAPAGLVTTAVNAALPTITVATVVPVGAPIRRSRLPMAIVAAACLASIITVGAFIGGGPRRESPASQMLDSVATESPRDSTKDRKRLDAPKPVSSPPASMAQAPAATAGAQKLNLEESASTAAAPVERKKEAEAAGQLRSLARTEPFAADSFIESRRQAASLNDERGNTSADVAIALAPAPASPAEQLIAGSTAQPGDEVEAEVSSSDSTGSTGGFGSAATDDDLPFPDRTTVLALMQIEPTELIADTWSTATALRYVPAAGTEIASADGLPPHRYAIFRTLNAASAPLLASDLNIRFPDAAVAFSDHVLVFYGRNEASGGEVGGAGIVGGTGGLEYFPGPYPVRKIETVAEVEEIALEYGGTLLSETSRALEFTFDSAGEANDFLTVVERLIGPGSTPINSSRMELLTNGRDVRLVVPLFQ
jgi:hypothetical protein